jgi:putative addiction module CopG family antidote
MVAFDERTRPMKITLPPKARKLVNERLKSGRYGSPEEVVLAGLASLRHQEEIGGFAPGELERLVAEGEASIEREGTVSADQVFSALRQRTRAARRGNGRGHVSKRRTDRK